MKMLIKSALFIALVGMVMVGCEKEESKTIHNESSNLNSVKKENKSLTKSNDFTKDEYIGLSFEDQKALWISKLDQIKSEPISIEQEVEINILINEIDEATQISDLHENADLEMAAFELLRLTSDQDFLLMFNTLDDYTVLNTIDYRYDIETSSAVHALLEDDFNGPFDGGGTSDKKKCNCNWTCGGAGSSCSHSDCKKTSSGCGFLWAFPCGKRDELYPQNCPTHSSN